MGNKREAVSTHSAWCTEGSREGIKPKNSATRGSKKPGGGILQKGSKIASESLIRLMGGISLPEAVSEAWRG